MLISPAYAQDVAGLMNGVSQFLPLILIFGVFYFLLIRPQQARAKQMKAMLAALRRGDRVMTAGGILANVTRVKDGSDEIEVEIAPSVRVLVMRDTISSVLKPVVANDTSKPAESGKRAKTSLAKADPVATEPAPAAPTAEVKAIPPGNKE
ncbi:MAG: preprotein translocase subunit YajC [Gemmatimonadaceae bacterium]|nr:preprotein translocase subunit YajC [Acetobacteraceae bacterium]